MSMGGDNGHDHAYIGICLGGGLNFFSVPTQQTKTREEHKIIWFISLERPVNIP